MGKILIVDDDATTRLVLKRALELAGHEVSMAKNGAEGLEQAASWHPELIICDWMMPLLDGLEVCRQIKADPELATIFFVLLTSRENVEDRVQGLDSGADDFLSKPIEVEELRARVRSGLRSRQLTQDLSQANQKLNSALQNLQHLQAQLVHNEKMFSLGQLAAGIAHEINNPITFIYSNLSHVRAYNQDLLDLLALYQQEHLQPSPQLQAKASAINLDFLAADLPKLLSSMKVGAERIQTIVNSLRNFTRLDEAEKKLADIRAGIDSTLLLLQHRLAAGNVPIQIVKNYGELPLIECYPGQLNQAFMHLLNNAIDALEAWQPADAPPAITITAEVTSSDRVAVRIADNGPGIDSSDRSRLFDPFFTTKPVGKGTGLGLTISYQIIVQQHGGILECHSEPGKGAEFAIEIPC